MRKLAVEFDCAVGEENEFIRNQFKLYVNKTSKLDALQTANLLFETGLFEFAEPNFIWLNAELTDDYYYDDQWNLKNTVSNGGLLNTDINIEPAWIFTKGSSSVRIAVIDCGVYDYHPDLEGNVLQGYDATGTYPQYGGIPINPGDDHGTAVAGVIAALQNNTEGISGVAPNCKIVPVRAGTANDYSSEHIANGINWVVNDGNSRAEVINISLGSDGGSTSPVTNAINKALNNGRGGKGCVVVAASGENGTSHVWFPASMSGVIAVGAINRGGTRYSGSSYGSGLDVVAPGADITTTWKVRSYAEAYGASVAAPHVSGIAALLLSMNPNLTQKQVANIITSTASNTSWDSQTGWGRVNARAALDRLFAIDGPSFDIALYEDRIFNVPTGVVGFTGWTISPSNGYTVTGGTYGTDLKIKFTTARQYTLTANFRLANGVNHSTSRVVNVTNTAVMPSISWSPFVHSTSPGSYITFYANTSQTVSEYIWGVEGGIVMSEFGNMISVRVNGSSPYLYVDCQILLPNGSFSPNASTSIVVMNSYYSAPQKKEKSEEIQETEQAAETI